MKSSRRALIAGMTAFVLAACGGDGGSGGTVDGLNDMAIGNADAPATLIEYASVTCGACYQFHRDVVPTLKEMVDDGRVRFVFREFPTAPNEVAVAGFAIARCAGDDAAYFEVLEDLFENQSGILAAARNGTVRAALQAVAARHGLDATAFETCLENEEVRTSIQAATNQGRADGVTGTPTFYLNGRQLYGAEGRTVESLVELIDAIAPPPSGTE